MIVGFPGETDADFQASHDLLAELRFDKVHVAAYSPRPGTFADHRQPDDVPAAIKSERLHAVEDLQRQVSSEINSTYLLQDVDVIVEQSKPADDPANQRLTGRTRTMKLVHFDAPAGRYRHGDLLTVTVTRTGAWSLQGIPANP